jgi:hypothetical protein
METTGAGAMLGRTLWAETEPALPSGSVMVTVTGEVPDSGTCPQAERRISDERRGRTARPLQARNDTLTYPFMNRFMKILIKRRVHGSRVFRKELGSDGKTSRSG